MACGAALAVLDRIDDEQLIARADAIGTRVVDHLHALARREDLRPIGHVRGLGAMIAFDLLAARDADATDPAATQAVIRLAHSLGLIVLGYGSHAEAVCQLVTLTIPAPVLYAGIAL